MGLALRPQLAIMVCVDGRDADEKDPEQTMNRSTIKTAISTFQVAHVATGADLGTWSGRHQGEALGRLAVSLGYENYMAMCAAGHGGERLRVTPVCTSPAAQGPRRCQCCGTREGKYTTLGGSICDDCV